MFWLQTWKYVNNIEMIISNCGLNTSRIYEDFLGIWSSITKLFHYMSKTRGRQRSKDGNLRIAEVVVINCGMQAWKIIHQCSKHFMHLVHLIFFILKTKNWKLIPLSSGVCVRVCLCVCKTIHNFKIILRYRGLGQFLYVHHENTLPRKQITQQKDPS